MYTVVLFMALGGGAEAPALGHHKSSCDGCTGWSDCCGGSYACCGGCTGYYGCCGGTVSYGCCGGSYSCCGGCTGDCHGGYGGGHHFRKHHRHHGHGGHDCCGGACHGTVIYYSCSGCCGGSCFGCSGGADVGCYGGAIVTPPAPPPPAKGGEKKGGGAAKDEGVSVPAPLADEIGFNAEALAPEKDAYPTRLSRLVRARLAS
jgi:hypothetical protein